MDEPQDSVDALVASWTAARPELDFYPVGVLTRLARVRRHVDTELELVFGEPGLDRGTWAVLATLARLGDLTAEELMAEVGMSGLAVSGYLDELEGSGLVVRAERVGLTEAGA